jgi:mono/diheme cytochrome c family protein
MPRLSARLIASEDLPPAGTRSLFDHLVAQNESLPYPFEKLVAMLQKQDPEGRAPVTLMIPQGRSLLKAQADFHHPRVLVAADFQAPGTPASLGLSPRGQLFLGFVENANEIEVLSYNEAAGRFEFQLVQDYSATGARRIVYARRAVCTTCHQGGTPIFPQRPWAETNGQPEIAAQIIAARGAQPYLGMPATQPLGSPERFDELTDTGAFVAVAQQVWIDGCGLEAADCRRLMLKLALRYLSDPGSFDAQGAEAAQLRQMQARAWPAEGIAVPESDLRNRDPLAEQRGLRNRIRAFFTPAPKPGEGARNNDDLVAFDRLPKLPAALDPLTPRPPKRLLSATDIDGVYGLAALFSEGDRARLEQAGGITAEALEQAVDRLDPTLFKAGPFSRVKTMQSLLAALGEKTLPAYCCLETAEMSPPQASGGPPLKLAANSPLLPFEEYCFTCHRGNPAKRLDFMGGRNEAEVLEQVKATAKIRDALDWDRYRGTDKEHTLMPPADSAQRAALEAALKQDPKLLERMRETVPGLFDF